MPRRSENINAFNAGELSPELQGRTDLKKYSEGAKSIENFIVHPEGGLHRRTGSRFVKNVHTDSVKSRLIPFIFSTTQAYILEFTDKKIRVFAEPNEWGITCDLLFEATVPAVEEPRTIQRQPHGRITTDTSRYSQVGCWSGTLEVDGTRYDIRPEEWRGARDHSWGVRGVGEPETGGAPVTRDGIFFLWAPLFWDDHITHAIFFDGAQGQPIVREGIVAPLYASEEEVPLEQDSHDERMATAVHRVEYLPGTRLAASAEIDLINLEGKTRTISLEPILKFQMKGLGYFHPEWSQGTWKGELELGGESFDPRQLDMQAPENIHVQQVVRASDGERTGIGVLEQVVVGPYAPAGFTGLVDGYKGQN